MQGLSIVVCDSPEDAIAKGYNYSEHDPKPNGLHLKKIVVVKNGTVGGRPTLDLVFEDGDGNKHVALVFSTLLEAAIRMGQ